MLMSDLRQALCVITAVPAFVLTVTFGAAPISSSKLQQAA